VIKAQHDQLLVIRLNLQQPERIGSEMTGDVCRTPLSLGIDEEIFACMQPQQGNQLKTAGFDWAKDQGVMNDGMRQFGHQ